MIMCGNIFKIFSRFYGIFTGKGADRVLLTLPLGA